MKRKIALTLILMFVMLTAAGCGNSLEDYKKASEKTAQITKGQVSCEFTTEMDFFTEGMTPEEISDLNYYKKVSGNSRVAFDSSKNLSIFRNYMNLGGLGLDFELYQNGDEVFVKLPIVGKYMKLDDLIKKAEQSPQEQGGIISDKTAKALSEEWIGILKTENVFKGKDIVLTTPDGEVKTKVYTITLNEAQVKTLEERAADILSEDGVLRKNFESMMRDISEPVKFADFDELIAAIREQIATTTVKSFQYTAYVDIDGYIVNEKTEVEIRREAPERGEPKSISFKMEQETWDINKDQKFEFPELTEENTLKTDELDQNTPSLFKDLFPEE